MMDFQSLYFQNQSISEVTTKEWLITNGLGGYASSTVCGLNSRKYHGLLVAALNPPAERKVLVSKVEEKITIDSVTLELSTNQYPDNIHPKGYIHLKEFSRYPFPKFTFRYESAKIEKTVFMVYGANTTVVRYLNLSESSVELSLNPLFNDRDFHSLSKKGDGFNYYCKDEADYLKIYPKSNSVPIFFKHSKGNFLKHRVWYNNIQYKEEEKRGMDFSEDLFSIGLISATLAPNESIDLIFSLEQKHMIQSPEVWVAEEKERLEKLVPNHITNEWVRDLIISGNQFIAKRKSTDSFTIIAGYHWFADWGRDTMIAIRGLCIALEKQEEARAILKTFLIYLDQGMLPNRFPDSGEVPEYNTVDATLWLFVALYEYYQAFKDLEFIRDSFPQLLDIIESHIKGTRFSIHVTQEGLIYAGNPNSQLTWMDAKCKGIAATPRHGCAVEINALWYNSLKIFEFFSKELNEQKNNFSSLTENCKTSFKKYFVNSEGYLNDVIIPERSVDKSFRPNQIFALSLPFSILDEDKERQILLKIKEELYTPYGLRTLTKSNPNFKAKYEGDVWCRDNAYHQGTVWPFLLGEYFQAYLRVNNHSLESKTYIEESLHDIKIHFYHDACIWGISEIFDGENPSTGRGAIHQAWSVANLLKVILEAKLFQKA